jgi:hypothetical protein
LKQAILVNYGTYGLGLPRVVSTILRRYWDPVALAGACLVGIFLFYYLSSRRVERSNGRFPGRISMLKYTGCGLAVFVAGYAIFLTNGEIQLTATGIGNRTAIAAALGVAISMVGFIGCVSGFLRSERARIRLFSMLVAVICASGLLINNALASFWKSAYLKQRGILVEIQEHFPTLASGSTIILDGVCPYVGPAVVFQNSWDLAGALQLLYHDNNLQGEVVSAEMTIKDDGIHTADCHYSYDKLFVYDFRLKAVHRVTSASNAKLYFDTFNTDRISGCPRGIGGYGVPVF